MITRSVPKKLSELGRLRIGDREMNTSGKGTHPHKLDVFRLTSSNRSLLQYAANAYGGEVHPWESDGAPRDEHNRPTQFELYTTANAIDVLIPTFSAVSLSFEQWSAAGCQRRCTGEVITTCPLNEALIDTPCSCPEDDQERAELAKTGKACARILRLNVLLPDLPGIGSWRLETKGYYATAELQGTLDMLQMAGQEHSIIEAVLRLEQRTTKKPGKGDGKGTLQYCVPVLWPKYTPRQILAGAAQVLLAPPPAQAMLPLSLDHALTQRIDLLLIECGLGPEDIAAYWQRMAKKYPDLNDPCVLDLLYEQLRNAAGKKREQAAEPTPEQLNPASTAGQPLAEDRELFVGDFAPEKEPPC